MSSSLRVGIIGARRVRQGLGPFVARDLVKAGADVCVVLGTTDATADEAAIAVERTTRTRPGAVSDAASFYAQDLDAVCVLTPAGTHLAHVEAALDRGCHVLCEKPVAWSPETAWAEAVARLEDRAAARGLHLAVNTQWPFALPAFEAVTGQSTSGAQRLAMGLAPASTGRQMLGDALPHPLSVAQALSPSIESARVSWMESASPTQLHLRAELIGPDGTLELEVHLDGDAALQPREAWLSIDGRRADRCVRKSDYALFLRSGAGLVDLPDPLTAGIRAFVDDVEVRRGAHHAPYPADRTHSRRAAMLADLVAAYDSSPR